ncbi:hypothetical protein QYF61_012105 [Mycteria americana]|uniref:Uncharacterized protein n=1 Tax=Mycteria americana TaxID=33587 RepID=A0AAN7NCL5_MYCAM|nr:hypothetical protein QYF61_012105 [Mycteria americana]
MPPNARTPKSFSAGLLSIPSSPKPVLIPGVALTHVQDLALGLVEPHEVHMGPLLELVQVPLDGILSLRHEEYLEHVPGKLEHVQRKAIKTEKGLTRERHDEGVGFVQSGEEKEPTTAFTYKVRGADLESVLEGQIRVDKGRQGEDEGILKPRKEHGESPVFILALVVFISLLPPPCLLPVTATKMRLSSISISLVLGSPELGQYSRCGLASAERREAVEASKLGNHSQMYEGQGLIPLLKQVEGWVRRVKKPEHSLPAGGGL